MAEVPYLLTIFKSSILYSLTVSFSLTQNRNLEDIWG